MERRRFIVCGGRTYRDKARVWEVLDQWRPTEVIHGDAGKTRPDGTVECGADRLAGEWAKARGVPCRVFPADWETDGPKAGPIRNSRMLHQKPDAVLAFPGGHGTGDMVSKARKADVPVIPGYRRP